MKNLFISPESLVGCGVLAVALGLLTSPLYASDQETAAAKSKDTGAPDMEQMMKKMEEMAAPGPEHKTLGALSGTWEADVRCFGMGSESSPMVSKGTSVKKMILGDRFLQEEFQGDMMGKQFQGIGLTGYDKFNKKYVGIWTDDMGTGIFVIEGTADPSGKVLTMTGKMDDPMTGQKQKPVKVITRILTPDKHTFEMHDLADGKDTKMMDITYVRKSGTPAGDVTAK